jgi:protein-S-isoprenylcysteine O-methyltransferase Ste14
MITQKLVATLLVAIQFLCLIYLALTGPWVADWPWLALEMAGGLLGVWAVVAMRLDRLRVTPTPRQGVELVEAGPYRWIRHPMYVAVLLVALALVLHAPSAGRWGAWIVLAVDLLVKLNYEERLLAKALPAYAAYRQRTWRLVPGLY